jgi:phosphohistidine phosphatase
MYLYLVQHAEAKPEQEDPARALSQRGRAELHKVALFTAAGGKLKVGSIQHSPKVRATETALLLAQHMEAAPDRQQADGLLPLDDPEIWAGRLTETHRDCMLVGHLPHLAKLASLLLTGSPEKTLLDFKMGGIACLHRDAEGGWSVSWMLIPEMLP